MWLVKWSVKYLNSKTHCSTNDGDDDDDDER